jgi:hypothetical protein
MNQSITDPLGQKLTFGAVADKAIRSCRLALYLFVAFCMAALVYSALN